ncbi:MAG: mechanosensitive ion channel family protein [Aggregatilineaceae bacterium]
MLAEFIRDKLGEGAADLIARLALIAVILLLTWLVRQVITAVIPRAVRRVMRRWNLGWDERLIVALQPPVRFVVTIIGLWAVLLALELPTDLRTPLVRVMNSLLIAGLFWGVYRLVSPAVAMFLALNRRRARPTAAPTLLDTRLAPVIEQIGGVLVWLIGLGAIVDAWGYDVAGLIAGLGIGGLAVALAAQDTLANLFGYFVILADEPFQIGDFVIFDHVKGTVERLGLRSTRIRAPDQSLITVPNRTVMNASITNWSRLRKRRLDMTLSIDYSSSPQQVLSVVQAIREMLQGYSLVERDSVVVQFAGFREGALDIMIICFVNTPDWADFQAAKQDINLKIMALLAERGVSISAPSLTVYLQQTALAESQAGSLPTPAPRTEPLTSTARESPPPSDAVN